jgi:ABC-type antimicrobial peptide transport system permease subunit
VLVQSSNQEVAEIVGVVGDVRHSGLTAEPAPTVYLLHAQTPGYITNLVVRTSGSDPRVHIASIRRAIHDADPTQAVSGARPFGEDVAGVLARPRLYAALVTCFALIAAMLAAVGIYGLTAYVVTARTHEIGNSLALGASRGTICFELIRHGAGLVAGGLVAGIAAAWGLRQLLSALVFGVTTGDLLTYVLAALALAGAGLVAAVVPAYRATQVPLTSALRCD